MHYLRMRIWKCHKIPHQEGTLFWYHIKMDSLATRPFKAAAWLTRQGYDVTIDDVKDRHTLSKDGVNIQVHGDWRQWSSYLNKEYVQAMLPKIHYAASLNPNLILNLDNKENWPDQLMQTEKNWLGESENLMQRVLESGQQTPQRMVRFIENALRCTSGSVSLRYYLTGASTNHELYIEIMYTGIKGPWARVSAAQLMEKAGVAHGVESLLGDPWTIDWWNSIRNIYATKKAGQDTYVLPDDPEW